MTTRMQVTLSAEEHRRAKAKAAALGVSLAEYLRRLVADDLGERTQRGDVSAMFGLGDSGGSDVSRHKDADLGEAVSGR